VIAATLPGDGFLPGILVREGGLVVDVDRLRYPGDLLHEAGHLAVLAPSRRRAFGDPGGTGGLDMREVEIQAIAWSYAAAIHLQLDPALVFHAGGYHGHAAGLLRNFALGVHIGVSHLQDAGMAVTVKEAERLGALPYPHMIRWLRE
jgi:hypothetical protein